MILVEGSPLPIGVHPWTATNLPTSSEPAINATGNAEAAKIAISPTIENHAAIGTIAMDRNKRDNWK